MTAAVASSTIGAAPNTTDTQVQVVLPSGIIAGETIAVIYRTVAAGGVTTPSGYTASANNQTAAGYFSKIADGTEGGTTLTLVWASGTGRGEAVALRITGAHPTTPIDVDGTNASTPSSGSVTVNGVTTTADNELLLAIGTCADGGSTSTLLTNIAGFVTVRDVSAFNAGTSSARVHVQSGTSGAQGATGNKTYTNNGSTTAMRMFMIAIKSAPTSVPAYPANRRTRHLVVR